MKITQAILPVAGLGTRFLPWTKTVPKEMLPLGNTPIIAHIVDECLDAGIREICFIISKGKEMIPQYFFKDLALEEELRRRGKLHHLEELKRYDNVDFHIAYQDRQLGDGHAILQAADWVKNFPVAVLFGDDLFRGTDSGLSQLIRAYDVAGNTGAMVALENVEREAVSRYGIVEVEYEDKRNPRLKKLNGLVEKPKNEDAPSTLAIVGRYLIPQSTLKILPSVGVGHGGEIRLIDALIAEMGNIPIHGYECEGTRIDTGTPEGYAEAVKSFGELKS
ncbi:MAG: sugar phosphate nucleotidyltransferase [Candidatus Peregrinibacteria bacterium]